MFKKLAVFLFVTLSAGSVFAQDATHAFAYQGRLLNAVACNASAGARRFTLSQGAAAGFGVGLFQLDFTYAAATAWTITCETSINSQTSWAVLPTCTGSTSAGVCTLAQASWTHAIAAASDNFPFRIDFLGAPDIRCTVACTGGGASDLFSLYANLTTM